MEELERMGGETIRSPRLFSYAVLTADVKKLNKQKDKDRKERREHKRIK